MGSKDSFVCCDDEFLAGGVLAIIEGWAVRWGVAGYSPCRQHNDLPRERQANQIPSTAIKAERMPKTICMTVSSCIVCGFV